MRRIELLYSTPPIGHDLDNLDLHLPLGYLAQNTYQVWYRPNPGSNVLDRADYTVPTRQHELDHTDHTDQGYVCPEISTVDNQVGSDDLQMIFPEYNLLGAPPSKHIQPVLTQKETRKRSKHS